MPLGHWAAAQERGLQSSLGGESMRGRRGPRIGWGRGTGIWGQEE